MDSNSLPYTLFGWKQPHTTIKVRLVQLHIYPIEMQPSHYYFWYCRIKLLGCSFSI